MKPSIEAIWNEFSAQLDRFIRTRVADAATAQDILQDVFVKLQARLDEFHDPAKLQGWLLLVARNAVIDYYRTRKPLTELPETLVDPPGGDGVEEEELRTVFHSLLLSLPEPDREALILTEFEDFTQEQLAKRLGISVSGAKSRVQRARERLKELLLDYCHQEFHRVAGSQPCPKGLLPPVAEGKPPRKRKSPRLRSKRHRSK